MKRYTWLGLLGSLAACLGVMGMGCAASSERAEDERIESEKQAFTYHAPNACTSACVGGAPNKICETSETPFNCGQDCSCGDGHCDSAGEDTTNCPIDCKFGTGSAVDYACGNNRCDPWERNPAGGFYCVQDCKLLAQDPPGTTCGDWTCDLGEDSAGCPGDCGNKALCGNGTCDEGYAETNATCPEDCTNANVKAGRFLGTECVGYSLFAKYSDGNGGVTNHLVTAVAAGCGGYPWKLDTNSGTCNGSKLVKPDGTICTIQGAACTTSIQNWASLGTAYVMAAQDPNKCNSYTNTAAGFQPIEWSKQDQVTCSTQAPCQRYQCNGQVNQITSGTVWRWVPKVAPWSFYAPFCQ